MTAAFASMMPDAPPLPVPPVTVAYAPEMGLQLHVLRLAVARAEGVLVRILGVVVRRGYEPLRVWAETLPGGDALSLTLEVESNRSPDLLARQLLRLYDVRRVEVLR